jgi:hypothetical protein
VSDEPRGLQKRGQGVAEESLVKKKERDEEAARAGRLSRVMTSRLSRLSVTLGAVNTTVGAVGVRTAVTSGGQVMVGGVVSWTSTLKEHLAMLPPTSMTANVMMVEPTLKTLLLGKPAV